MSFEISKHFSTFPSIVLTLTYIVQVIYNVLLSELQLFNDFWFVLFNFCLIRAGIEDTRAPADRRPRILLPSRPAPQIREFQLTFSKISAQLDTCWTFDSINVAQKEHWIFGGKIIDVLKLGFSN